MENLDRLYQWLDKEGVFLFDRQLPFSKKDSYATTIKLKPPFEAWGIFLDKGRLRTEPEEKSALLHESGHYATGTTHEASSPFDLIQKHEYKADKWAVQRALSADELDEAVAEGHIELWDLAEYFGVTEELMRKAVCWYTYGNLDADLYF
jgi:hypothetical protein